MTPTPARLRPGRLRIQSETRFTDVLVTPYTIREGSPPAEQIHTLADAWFQVWCALPDVLHSAPRDRFTLIAEEAAFCLRPRDMLEYSDALPYRTDLRKTGLSTPRLIAAVARYWRRAQDALCGVTP